MDEFLIINGIAYMVVETGAQEDEPEVGGSTRRAWDMSLLSTVQGEKRNWTFQLIMTRAEYAVLKADTDAGAIVSIGGLAVEDVPGLTAQVRIQAAAYVRDGNSNFQRLVTVRIVQA